MLALAKSTKTGPTKDQHVTVPSQYMEDTPKRPFMSTFDDVLLTLKLEPGANGKGAVVSGWHNRIAVHDEIVLQVESAMATERRLAGDLKVAKRMLANWEVAFSLINTTPLQLLEYARLKAELSDYKGRYKLLTSTQARIQLEAEWDKYMAMKGPYEKVLHAQTALEGCAKAKEEAQHILLEQGRIVTNLKLKEREAAALISEDHVTASDREVRIEQLFPAVQPGYIITKIFTGNEVKLEDLPFDKVLQEIKEAFRPHTLEFSRYDYKHSPTTGDWVTLAQYRAMGCYVEDPRVAVLQFVQACSNGDIPQILWRLQQGADPNCADQQGRSGMHCGAANGHVDVMDILLKAGANLDVRDANMETPVLTASRRGCEEGLRWLLEQNACVTATDRGRRTALMLAIAAGSKECVHLLMANAVDHRQADMQWVWTPLHYACHHGMIDTVTLLLKRRASPYMKSREGLTPLQVAESVKQEGAASVLRSYLTAEPAHCIFVHNYKKIISDANNSVVAAGKALNAVRSNISTLTTVTNNSFSNNEIALASSEVWIGRPEAAYPLYATDRGYEAILCIKDGRSDAPMHSKLSWLEDGDSGVTYMRVDAEINHESMELDSWYRLALHMKKMLNFIDEALNAHKRLLMFDDTGTSTCVGVWAAYRLLRKGEPVTSTVSAVHECRTVVAVSPAIAIGLQYLQLSFQEEKTRRLKNRVRKATILSLGF